MSSQWTVEDGRSPQIPIVYTKDAKGAKGAIAIPAFPFKGALAVVFANSGRTESYTKDAKDEPRLKQSIARIFAALADFG